MTRVMSSDRAAPGWARGLSYAFAIGSGFCFLGAAVSIIFFFDLVVVEGQIALIPALLGVSLTLLFGSILFDFSHSRALAGYRHARGVFFSRAQAALSVGIVVVMELVHPALGLPVLVTTLISLVTNKVLYTRKQREPFWDFSAKEAVSVLSGRDEIGRKLATKKPELHSLGGSIQKFFAWIALFLSIAVNSWLAATEVLSVAAVPAVSLISFWCTDVLGKHMEGRSIRKPFERSISSNVLLVDPIETDDDEDIESDGGLSVQRLTVNDGAGHCILADVNFSIEPGTILGILGESGGGKSILLRALMDPHGLPNLDVRGRVHAGVTDLWERSARSQVIPAVLLADPPLVLPATGLENLDCFGSVADQMRAEKTLEKLIFSADIVRGICKTRDATTLPSMQRKMLTYARGLLLAPSLYLMDRPEDLLPEKQVSALIGQIQQEARLGRTVVMVTDNRALLEICDKHLVLQEGRVNDFGNAIEIRNRLSSGWTRFVASRKLESEDNLDRWIRAHFKRNGDEGNRRKVCTVASEMLALSCQNADPSVSQSLSFEFKHFEGHCLLKMTDGDQPLGAARLQKAKKIAQKSDSSKRLPPLAALIDLCEDVQGGSEMDRRVLSVKIGTYDPRKTKSAKRAPAENAQI